MNTHHNGEINLVIMRDDKKDEFVGFCYEFAIVKYGEDMLELKAELIEASKGYLKAVSKEKLPIKLLNRSDELPKEFQDLYQAITHKNKQKASPILSNKIASIFKKGDAYLVPACV